MSDKNKKFRSHCDLDILLDKETSTVSVKVNYKPEMFTRPMGALRHRYSLMDVKEELCRQGIVIDEDSVTVVEPHAGVIDNTSTRVEKHSLAAIFKLTPNAPNKTNKPATPPNPEPVSSKKTSKTKTKTTNK
jgi:hypothetical protein